FIFKEQPAANAFTPSLHDALPIFKRTRFQAECRTFLRIKSPRGFYRATGAFRGASAHAHSTAITPAIGTTSRPVRRPAFSATRPDRKSTRLNSSHVKISYAVFCLK